MEPFLNLRRSVDGLHTFLDTYTSDLSPVLLTQPPYHRLARRKVLQQGARTLDQQWSKFQEIFVELCDARAKLCRLRAMAQSALSPVSALPHEVLAKIFGFACDIFHFADPARIYKLSRVCRDWYNVAIAHKPLWSFSSIKSVDDIDKLAIPLERCSAGDFTLSVWPRPDAEIAEPVNLKVLASLRQELACLKWWTHQDQQIDSLFDILKTSKSQHLQLPSLRSLDIRSLDDGYILDLSLSDLPKLDLLRLVRVRIDQVCPDAVQSVQTLSISDVVITPRVLVHMLENMPNLRSLHLEDIIDDGSVPPNTNSSLPDYSLLEELSMYECEEEFMWYLLGLNWSSNLKKVELITVTGEFGHEPAGTPWGEKLDSVNAMESISSLSTCLYRTDYLLSIPFDQIQQTTNLSVLNLILPIHCARAVAAGLYPSISQAQPLASLDVVYLMLTDISCRDPHCANDYHTKEEGMILGKALIDSLRARGCTQQKIRDLKVSECMWLDTMTEVAINFSTNPCECTTQFEPISESDSEQESSSNSSDLE